MSRTVAWFSAGAASAVAAKLCSPDVIAYCHTGAEDPDNSRFIQDCEAWFEKKVTVLRSVKYDDTWDVWEKRKYIAGIQGAPCTGELKIKPRENMQQPGDIHVFGYTADARDAERAQHLEAHSPELRFSFPLIERGLNKAAVLQMVVNAGIAIPRTYALGFEHANCIPCPKATSPSYWALIRKHYPDEFERMVELSRRLGARLTRINGERCFIDEIPQDMPTTNPVQPACDFLCQIAEADLNNEFVEVRNG